MATTTPPSIVIEVCVDSVESAKTAVEAGANRLELCGNLGIGGGTTPSLGLVKVVQESVRAQKVPIMVMIRPRTGDFLYSEEEMKVMLQDVEIFKGLGIHGIVVGILTADGAVDVERMRKLVDVASPLEVCFHRAFDMTRNPIEAIQSIRSIGGITRILTSGQCPRAIESLELLKSLLKAATSQDSAYADSMHVSIMPGSGVNPQTIGPILSSLQPYGLKEIHLSGGQWFDNGMTYRHHGLGMGVGEDEWSVFKTQRSTLQEVKGIAEGIYYEHTQP